MLDPITTFEARFGPVRYFMAPMAGITDTVFRSLVRELGAEVVISELISAEGLIRGGQKTKDLMYFCEAERPVGIQIFGSSIASLTEAAKIVEAEGADFVDINFGCPVKKVVCDGGGAAWLRDPLKLGELLQSVKAALRIPLTIKVRTGWDESTRNIREVVHVAAEEGISWVAIHGRTRAQGYSGQADWELIREVAHQSRLPIIGNGDILSAEAAREKLEAGYAHAVMIGRGALKNPWIFQEIRGQSFEQKDFLPLIKRHFELALVHKDPYRAHLSLKKFMGWYAAGFPYSSQFRQQIFGTHNLEELWGIASDYFSSARTQNWKMDAQPFLMGGHG